MFADISFKREGLDSFDAKIGWARTCFWREEHQVCCFAETFFIVIESLMACRSRVPVGVSQVIPFYRPILAAPRVRVKPDLDTDSTAE